MSRRVGLIRPGSVLYSHLAGDATSRGIARHADAARPGDDRYDAPRARDYLLRRLGHRADRAALPGRLRCGLVRGKSNFELTLVRHRSLKAS